MRRRRNVKQWLDAEHKNIWHYVAQGLWVCIDGRRAAQMSDDRVSRTLVIWSADMKQRCIVTMSEEVPNAR